MPRQYATLGDISHVVAALPSHDTAGVLGCAMHAHVGGVVEKVMFGGIAMA